MTSFIDHTLDYFRTTPGWEELGTEADTTYPPKTKFHAISYNESSDETVVLTLTSSEEFSPSKDKCIITHLGGYYPPRGTSILNVHIYAYLPPTTQEKDA